MAIQDSITSVQNQIKTVDELITAMNEEKERSNEQLINEGEALKVAVEALLAARTALQVEHDGYGNMQGMEISLHTEVHAKLIDSEKSLHLANQFAEKILEKNADSHVQAKYDEIKTTTSEFAKLNTAPVSAVAPNLNLMLELMRLAELLKQFAVVSRIEQFGSLPSLNGLGGITIPISKPATPSATPSASPSASPSPSESSSPESERSVSPKSP